MSIYGLGNRDEITEMRERYNAMVNTLAYMFNCGRWDIEDMFDSNNNIEVGEIVKEFVDEVKELPSWNTIYYEAMLRFADEHELEMGKDVDIYPNACLDTHIYARKGLDKEIVEELEDLFGTDAEELV